MLLSRAGSRYRGRGCHGSFSEPLAYQTINWFSFWLLTRGKCRAFVSNSSRCAPAFAAWAISSNVRPETSHKRFEVGIPPQLTNMLFSPKKNMMLKGQPGQNMIPMPPPIGHLRTIVPCTSNPILPTQMPSLRLRMWIAALIVIQVQMMEMHGVLIHNP